MALDMTPSTLVDLKSMGWCYRRLLRPLFFLQDSEAAHNRVMRGLACAGRGRIFAGLLKAFYSSPGLPINCLGLNFPNPIGLAAGMDKAAIAIPIWPQLGFGFSELGGVTHHQQLGNESPRMFRAITENAIVNRMGFNNPGADSMAKTLATWRELGKWPTHPVGINLGKSKITPLNKAPEDYAFSFRLLQSHADFFVINVSSPNTPNLRQLQDKTALNEIIVALREVNTEKPLLVKVAPDLTDDAINDVIDLVGAHQLSGVVATNTTTTRPETSNAACKRTYNEIGGLSGAPLRARSTEVIRHIHKQTKGTLPIIGVGGISNTTDAWEKITAGATLLQLYTGLVYEGPGIAKAIVSGLSKRLEKEGMKSLMEAVGTANS